MANKPLQSIKFPDLPDTYTVPVVDSTLAVSGAAADAKQTGDSLADKVDKVSGKGLSTNDYTNEEKTKLAGIETGATKTIIDSTLTQTGQAADAKTVGDAIASEDKKALAAFATDTASGSIASFPDGADSIPMKDVLVHIEPVQEGSGDPSPDNVRPITGWTACVISHSGADMTNPTTYSITFPAEAGTVYGGTLDVTTGELVVDRAMVDLGTLEWNALNGAEMRARVFEYTMDNGWDYSYVNISSNALVVENPDMAFANRKVYDFTNKRWNFYNFDCKVPENAFADANAFKTWLNDIDGNGMHAVIVIPMAAPITYTLTPQEITSLLGTNSLWADTGDTEVEYRADAKLYITKKITEAVSALS